MSDMPDRIYAKCGGSDVGLGEWDDCDMGEGAAYVREFFCPLGLGNTPDTCSAGSCLRCLSRRLEESQAENARLREYYEAAMADNARLREYYEARESLDRCILFQESGLIACQERFASAWSVMQETEK